MLVPGRLLARSAADQSDDHWGRLWVMRPMAEERQKATSSPTATAGRPKYRSLSQGFLSAVRITQKNRLPDSHRITHRRPRPALHNRFAGQRQQHVTLIHDVVAALEVCPGAPHGDQLAWAQAGRLNLLLGVRRMDDDGYAEPHRDTMRQRVGADTRPMMQFGRAAQLGPKPMHLRHAGAGLPAGEPDYQRMSRPSSCDGTDRQAAASG